MASYDTTVQLHSKGFCDIIDITGDARKSLSASGIKSGIMTLFVPGSTGAVTTIEYEEGVIEDLRAAIDKLAPSGATYKHDMKWGDGNGFSHVRAALMKPGITVPVVNGEVALGTWQQIVFIDFDNRPRKRSIVVQIIGD